MNGSPAVLAIAFRTAQDRIGVAPLGSAQRSSAFRRLVIAVTYSAEVCFALGRTALLLIVVVLCFVWGKPERASGYSFLYLAMSIIIRSSTCPQVAAVRCP